VRTAINLDDLAASIVGCFPTLDSVEQRLSLELYQSLAKAQPVPRESLAERLGISLETVNRILDSWPGVFSDAQSRVVGYWGIALPEAHSSPHRFAIDGRVLSAWCAWDTLFLPQLLGQTTQVESTSPAGDTVCLTIAPDRIEIVEPSSAQMSFLVPDCKGVQNDVLSTFCQFVHFFPSREVAGSWTAQHAGTFLMSIHEGHALARQKNEAQYREVLGIIGRA
jgi:alkylmercury lyase